MAEFSDFNAAFSESQALQFSSSPSASTPQMNHLLLLREPIVQHQDIASRNTTTSKSHAVGPAKSWTGGLIMGDTREGVEADPEADSEAVEVGNALQVKLVRLILMNA